jgi:hypothetical protein
MFDLSAEAVSWIVTTALAVACRLYQPHREVGGYPCKARLAAGHRTQPPGLRLIGAASARRIS